MNSSYNVTESTKALMIEEFKRGHECCMANLAAKDSPWEKLCEPAPFFSKFVNYLQVRACMMALATLGILKAIFES